MVKTYRMAADGEGGISQSKTLLFPKSHSMFAECSARGNAPVFTLCGLPLMVEKVKPYKPLAEGYQRDNQWATWMMIEPHTGFAPAEWVGGVGPVLVYRPRGLDFGPDDALVINDFLSGLLDMYSNGPEFNPSTWLNKTFFQNFVRVNTNGCVDEDDGNNRKWVLHILD